MGHSFSGSKGKNTKKTSMSSSPFIQKLNKHYKTDATSATSTAISDNPSKNMSSANTMSENYSITTSIASSDSSSSKMSSANLTTREDERGFLKTENFTMMNPNEANFQETVKLVERNPCPNGFQLVDPEKSGKKNQFDLVELAGQIQTADQFTRATAGSKLSVIAEQVRFLQQQAQAVLEEASLNKELHHIACNFKKVPGKIYYVYRREETGAKYMSMISPEEWGANCPLFDAAYKLQHDMSFTPYDKINKRDNDEEIIDKILKINSNQLSLGFQ